jgi:hypothetical protein
MTELQEKLKIGPREGAQYPIIVNYCGVCTMPIEVNIQNLFLLINFFFTHL